MTDHVVFPCGQRLRKTGQRLVAAALAVGAIALAGCGEVDGGSNTTAAEIRAQEAIWRDAIIDDYDILYKVRCLCPTKDRFVQVRAGRIERVEYNWTGNDAVATDTPPSAIVPNADAPPVDHGEKTAVAHHYDDYYHEDYVYTVDRLFDIVRDAHTYAYAVNVTWHPSLGFPTELRIDWYHNGIDDEYQILVIDFSVP